jgi:predicted nucleic acid-binding protein
VKLLLDTNIFIEILLGQAKADEAKALLSQVDTHDFFITDFALHSIGLLLLRQGKSEIFRQFLADVINAGITLVMLTAAEMDKVIDAASKFNLDFDDAYQYTVAEKLDLSIVSFDGDFDRTTRGRTQPTAVMVR